jgi:hypothetical protein
MAKCKMAISERLGEALEDTFPARDPPTLAEPAGDARNAIPRCRAEARDAARTPLGSDCAPQQNGSAK